MNKEGHQWHKSRSLFESLRYAWRGVREVYASENNVRRESLLFAAAFLLAVILGLPISHLAIILLISALIICLEFMNTALESIEDIIWPEYREAVRRSKDVAAGAVLVASMFSLVIAVLLFVPPIVQLALLFLTG